MPKRKPDRSERSEAVNLIYEHGFDAGLRAGSENSRKRAGEAYRLGYSEGYQAGYAEGYEDAAQQYARARASLTSDEASRAWAAARRAGLVANPERVNNGCMVYRTNSGSERPGDESPRIYRQSQ